MTFIKEGDYLVQKPMSPDNYLGDSEKYKEYENSLPRYLISPDLKEWMAKNPKERCELNIDFRLGYEIMWTPQSYEWKPASKEHYDLCSNLANRRIVAVLPLSAYERQYQQTEFTSTVAPKQTPEEKAFELGKRLIELRVGFGYTLNEVSKKTGVPVDYIERLVDGSKDFHPSTNALYKLADFYKCDLKELLILGGVIIPKGQKMEFRTPKERDNLDLLELVCQLHSRALMYPSEKMHNAYMEARTELEKRLSVDTPDKKDLESSVPNDSSYFATLRSGFGNSDGQEKEFVRLLWILEGVYKTAKRKIATECDMDYGKVNEFANTLWEKFKKDNNLEHFKFLSPSREDGCKPKVVCLCGSTRFAEWFMIKRWELEKQGIITFGINILPDNYFAEGNSHGAEQEGVKDVLDELHKRKIDLSDEVFVLNVSGYIGESTRNEIEYAEKTGKPIKYLEPLPAPPKQ